MSRTPLDSFSKLVLEELLAPLGEVSINREVPGESQYVDVYFVPLSQTDSEFQNLGLLGQIGATPCLIEPFRNPATANEVRSCLLKLFAMQADHWRRAKRDEQLKSQVGLPKLWILTPSMSEEALAGFSAIPESEGLYRTHLGSRQQLSA